MQWWGDGGAPEKAWACPPQEGRKTAVLRLRLLVSMGVSQPRGHEGLAAGASSEMPLWVQPGLCSLTALMQTWVRRFLSPWQRWMEFSPWEQALRDLDAKGS